MFTVCSHRQSEQEDSPCDLYGNQERPCTSDHHPLGVSVDWSILRAALEPFNSLRRSSHAVSTAHVWLMLDTKVSLHSVVHWYSRGGGFT